MRARCDTADPSVLFGVGADDCALLAASAGGRLAASCDTLVEGTHFTPSCAPRLVGRKAMAAAISDLAASGCRPRWCLVGLVLRRDMGPAWARELAAGMLAVAREFSTSLVGGDTCAGDGPASICVTVLGEPLPGGPVSRAGGRPGDVVAVTGELGGAWSDTEHGRHLRFTPRVREMEFLLAHARVRAAMDLSDGLGLDLSRLLEQSRCCALIEEQALPVAAAARDAAARSGRTPLEHALADGEDFELLLCVAGEDWSGLEAVWPERFPGLALTRIGSLVAGEGAWLMDARGRRRPLPSEGYEHGF